MTRNVWFAECRVTHCDGRGRVVLDGDGLVAAGAGGVSAVVGGAGRPGPDERVGALADGGVGSVGVGHRGRHTGIAVVAGRACGLTGRSWRGVGVAVLIGIHRVVGRTVDRDGRGRVVLDVDHLRAGGHISQSTPITATCGPGSGEGETAGSGPRIIDGVAVDIGQGVKHWIRIAEIVNGIHGVTGDAWIGIGIAMFVHLDRGSRRTGNADGGCFRIREGKGLLALDRSGISIPIDVTGNADGSGERPGESARATIGYFRVGIGPGNLDVAIRHIRVEAAIA